MCEVEREMRKRTRQIYVERQLRLRFVRTDERIAVELSTTVATVQSQHLKFMIIITIDTVYAYTHTPFTIYAQLDLLGDRRQL